MTKKLQRNPSTMHPSPKSDIINKLLMSPSEGVQAKLATMDKHVAENDAMDGNDWNDLNMLLKVAEASSYLDSSVEDNSGARVFRSAGGMLLYPATHPMPPIYTSAKQASVEVIPIGGARNINGLELEAKNMESRTIKRKHESEMTKPKSIGHITSASSTTRFTATKRAKNPAARASDAARPKAPETNQPQQQPQVAPMAMASIENVPDGNKKRKKKPKSADLSSALLRGVTVRPSGKWQAQLYFAGKSRYIGVFDSRNIAALAYEIARDYLKDKNVLPSSSKQDTDSHVNAARKAAFAGVC